MTRNVRRSTLFSIGIALCLTTGLSADTVLLKDNFDRQETDDSQEQVGGKWSTNSKARAKGNKQVDLIDGAMRMTRHEVADHGVSVAHDLQFKNAEISMRFRIGQGDELGINIADMKEKSVHAGHLCVAKIRLNKVTIIDLKTGRMKKEMRDKAQNKTLTADDRKLIKTKEKAFPIKLTADTWNDLKVGIQDDTMTVSINGKEVGQFASAGIDHDTKSRVRLAVAKDAWVDDIKVERK